MSPPALACFNLFSPLDDEGYRTVLSITILAVCMLKIRSKFARVRMKRKVMVVIVIVFAHLIMYM